MSLFSYKRYVNRQVDKFETSDRDEIDKIEDPFDLYSDEIKDEDNRDIKEILKEEKKKGGVLKKSTFKALPTNLSPFRILSYITLVIGFIYLKDNEKLDITLYLIGITAGIVITPILLNRFNR